MRSSPRHSRGSRATRPSPSPSPTHACSAMPWRSTTCFPSRGTCRTPRSRRWMRLPRGIRIVTGVRVRQRVKMRPPGRCGHGGDGSERAGRKGGPEEHAGVIPVVRAPIGEVARLVLELVQVASQVLSLIADFPLYFMRDFAHWRFSLTDAAVFWGGNSTAPICFLPPSATTAPSNAVPPPTASAAAHGGHTVARP